MTNMLCLVGRLNKEVELIEKEDKKYYKMELAVSRTYKNIDGIYETDIIPIILWNGIGEKTKEYCHKGDLVAVRGQLRSSTYTDSKDEKKYKVEVIVEKLIFLSTKVNDNKNEE